MYYTAIHVRDPTAIELLGNFDEQTLQIIKTVHNFAYYGFFKPPLGEVGDQLPEKFKDKTVYVTTLLPGDGDPSLCFSSDRKHHLGETLIFQSCED